MKFTLPKSAAESMPAPDDDGVIRVTAALKIGSDGKASLLSLNDVPIPSTDDEPDEDDANPAAAIPPPSADMESGDDY